MPDNESVSKDEKLEKGLEHETLQKMIAVTDDLLKTLITLSSALLGVGFIFDDFAKSPLVRVIIILLFFIGLVVSFLGVLPFNVKYDVEDVGEMKQQEVKTFRRKRTHVWASAIIMAAGFSLAIVDLFVDLFQDL